MATSTSPPPAGSLPTFNGGGIEFIAWSSRLRDTAKQADLLEYLTQVAPARASARASAHITPPGSSFHELDKPDIPLPPAGDFNLYKAQLALWREQSDKIKALRALIVASLADHVRQALFASEDQLFAATAPDLFRALRASYGQITNADRAKLEAEASVPIGDSDVTLVLARVAEYHRTLVALREPLADGPKNRHLLDVLQNSATFATLRGHFYATFPDPADQTYDHLSTMVLQMWRNRAVALAPTASFALTPALGRTVTTALTTAELRDLYTAVSTELARRTKGGRSTPSAAKPMCANHPLSTTHTTAECRMPKARPKTPPPKQNRAAAAEAVGDDDPY